MKNKKDHNNNVTVSLFYSLTIAATGQDSIASLAESSNSAGTSPMMFSANPSSFKSKTYGHTAVQAPHPIQLSFTLYIFYSSYLFLSSL